MISGCTRQPADMPKLYPCTITVLNNGQPLPNAEVHLAKENETMALFLFGKVGGNGKANIGTHYGRVVKTGVPEGEFKVAINQNIVLETYDPTVDTANIHNPRVVEYLKKLEEELERKRDVPKVLTDFATTPLTITIEPGKSNQLTVDITEYGEKTPKN